MYTVTGGGDKAVGLPDAGQITAPQKIKINQRIDYADAGIMREHIKA